MLRPPRAGIWYWGKQWPGVDKWYKGGYSHNAVIKGLYIHDLILNTKELISIAIQKLVAGGPINYEEITDNKLIPNQKYSQYKGNVLSDVIFGLRHISNNWWHLASTQIPQEFIDWAINGGSLVDNKCNHETICGYDAGGHVIKGVVGIKLVRSYKILFDNVTIENLVNIGDQGSTKCGQWVDGFLDDTKGDINGYFGSGHVDELRKDGYTGTHSRAIAIYNAQDTTFNNVKINNIMSFNGPSYGFFIHENNQEPWGLAQRDINSPENNIELNDIYINHIDSGLSAYNKGNILIDVFKPNWDAESCAISCETDTYCTNSIDKYNNININYMNGHSHGCQLCKMESPSNACIDTDVSDSNNEFISYITPFGMYTIGDGMDTLSVKDNTNNQQSIGLIHMDNNLDSKILVVNHKHSNNNNNNNNNTSNEKSDGIFRIYYFIGVSILFGIIFIMGYICYKPNKQDYYRNNDIRPNNINELKSLINSNKKGYQ